MTDDEIEEMLREAIDRLPAEQYRKVAALAWLGRQTTILREFRELGLLVDDDNDLNAALNERVADEVWIKAETKIGAKLAKLPKARETPGRGKSRAKAGRAKRYAT